MIRIFVGTDPTQAKAEKALENSIAIHASQPYHITWMRAGDPGWDNWNTEGWYTDFTCFRFAIPEKLGFEGRAIYLDVDMLVLGDVAELYNMPMRAPWLVRPGPLLDVCVIDAKACLEKGWPQRWPREGRKMEYVHQLKKKGMFDESLPEEWDHRDFYVRGETKLLHFTNTQTQPWHPNPERYGSAEHPQQNAVKIWQHYADL